MEEKFFELPFGFLFNQKMDVSDLVSILSFIAVVIGGVFALYQWRKTVVLKRADYIKDLTEKIRTDDDIVDVIYLLDYDDEWYNNEFHGNKILERKFDRTFAFFSYICYLHKQKIISNKEFVFFKYNINRILMNNQVQDYFYNLYHFSKKLEIPFSFDVLLDYAEENKILHEDFSNSELYNTDSKFHNYLNF